MPQLSNGENHEPRLSAVEIFETAAENAREELKRSTRALAFSGLAAGIAMSLTGIGVAIAQEHLGEGKLQDLLAYALYPLGFIVVIIGRQQLFTENTLFPVAVLLRDGRRWLRDTARLWAAVFVANVAGALLFALLLAKSGALAPEYLDELVALGEHAAAGGSGSIFWSGVVGGWLIALVAWLVTASRYTMGQIVLTWMLTYVVGIGGFAHCIAGSGEILTAVWQSSVSVGAYARWLLYATLGNIVGGVLIVALLNYAQVMDEHQQPYQPLHKKVA